MKGTFSMVRLRPFLGARGAAVDKGGRRREDETSAIQRGIRFAAFPKGLSACRRHAEGTCGKKGQYQLMTILSRERVFHGSSLLSGLFAPGSPLDTPSLPPGQNVFPLPRGALRRDTHNPKPQYSGPKPKV
jgi:hypothetical protein